MIMGPLRFLPHYGFGLLYNAKQLTALLQQKCNVRYMAGIVQAHIQCMENADVLMEMNCATL